MKVNWVSTALIRRLCYPDTYRLPHVDRLVVPGEAGVLESGYLPNSWRAGVQQATVMLPRDSWKTEAKPQLGNLSNDLYRFFVGSYIKEAMKCRCRWCDVEMFKDQCSQHLRAANCKAFLLECYTVLHKVGTCLVCSSDTKLRKWGLPLCSTNCENNWRFALSGALRHERTLCANRIAARVMKEG